MSGIPVLLAGTVGAGRQNHQADMWAPRLAAAGLTPAGVWTPPTVGDEAIARATDLADLLGVELEVSAQPTAAASGAIVCLRGAERIAFARFAADAGLPMLLDKPTVDDTTELEAFAAAAGTVVPGHHLGAHPGFTRALSAVRGAEIGLLRAVHADLVVAAGDGLSPLGELRNHGVYLVDLLRQATGPAQVRLQAHGTPEGDASAFLGQTERDVVVSMHVSRTGESAGGSGILRAVVRLIGTHGSLLVDLARPSIDVRTPRGRDVLPFGEDSVTALLARFAATIAGRHRPALASDLVTLSRALDGIAESASSANPTTLTW
jgi:predicted dehydrogenase